MIIITANHFLRVIRLGSRPDQLFESLTIRVLSDFNVVAQLLVISDLDYQSQPGGLVKLNFFIKIRSSIQVEFYLLLPASLILSHRKGRDCSPHFHQRNKNREPDRRLLKQGLAHIILFMLSFNCRLLFSEIFLTFCSAGQRQGHGVPDRVQRAPCAIQ